MTPREDYEQRILRVLLDIESSLDHPWTLKELAQIAVFSPYHFHRIFTGMVGESVASYIRRVRLERAASRLTSISISIVEIAREAGYPNPEAFSRAFTRRFGMPPWKFRETVSKWSASGDRAADDISAAAERVMSRWRAAAALRQAEAPIVEIVELPAITCAFVRATGGYAITGARAWIRLNFWAYCHGVRARDRRRFTIGHDDPALTDESRLRLDACVALDADELHHATGRVGIYEIPAGEYARLKHSGPIRTIASAFAELYGRWLPESGREPTSAPPLIEHIDNRFPSGPPGATAALIPLA